VHCIDIYLFIYIKQQLNLHKSHNIIDKEKSAHQKFKALHTAHIVKSCSAITIPPIYVYEIFESSSSLVVDNYFISHKRSTLNQYQHRCTYNEVITLIKFNYPPIQRDLSRRGAQRYTTFALR